MAEAQQKGSDLFTKIVTTKNEAAKAKAQGNRVRATPAAGQTTHLSRVEAPLTRVADPQEADCRAIPRVTNNPEDCCVVEIVANWYMPRPVTQAPCNTFPITVTTVPRAVSDGLAQLHLTGRGQQLPLP
jgi:hypothetical protein